jgi:PKHD-type hydroxylase
MILNSDYYWFKSALTDDQCDEIILRGENEMRLAKERGEKLDATTFGRNDKGGMLDSGVGEDELVPQGNKTNQTLQKEKSDEKKTFIRDTHVSWLNDEEIYSWVHPYLTEANRAAGWNFEWDWSESLQFTKYREHQFYGWHPDAGANPYPPYWDVRNPPEGEPFKIVEENGEELKVPKDGFDSSNLNDRKWSTNPNYAGKIRKLSMTVNLTHPKNYKGGNLKFDFGPHAERSRYHTCTEIRPRGSIIVFPSDRYHQVTPITSGLRYSLVMWSLGQPWR